MHVGIVEVVTHKTPRISEDLPPFLSWLNHYIHWFCYNQILELLVGHGVNDTGLTLTANEKLLAVGRHLHEVYLLENRFFLSFFVIGIE